MAPSLGVGNNDCFTEYKRTMIKSPVIEKKEQELVGKVELICYALKVA